MHPDTSAPDCAPIPTRRRKDHPNDHPGQAKTTYVRKRLLETLEFIDKKHLIQTPGITARTINLVLTANSTTVPWKAATPLDWAWAKYVKGHDLWELDVPHGNRSTYRTYACRCQHCTVAAVTRERHRLAGQVTANSPAPARTTERALLHLERLRQHATLRVIAKTCGVNKATLMKFADPEWDGCMTLHSAARLLGTTVADVSGDPSKRLMVDSRAARHLVGTMRALGYPMVWQEKRIGTRNLLWMVFRREQVTAYTTNRLAELARRVGDRQPGPGDGIDPYIAERTRREARAAGWYPPAAYDDDLRLDLTAIPNERWSKTDGWAKRRVAVVQLLADGSSASQASEATGVGRDVINTRIPHGLTYNPNVTNDESLNVEASAERIAEIRAVCELLEAGEYGYVYAALELGIQRGDYLALAAWKDHPEVLAWHADQEDNRATLPTPVAA